MLFLKNRQGSDFDCLKPRNSYIALSFRNQCIDVCTSPYRFLFSFNAPSLFLCSNPARNQRYISSFSFACGNDCVS
jgi:hypothetical protein